MSKFCAKLFGDRAVLRSILAEAQGKLTRREVGGRWPEGPDGRVPSDPTVRRHLEEAVARGLARRDGSGTRESPFRYWLAGKEEEWARDPMHLLRKAQEEAEEVIRDLLKGR